MQKIWNAKINGDKINKDNTKYNHRESMLVRLGYVAMTMNLKDSSPSGTVTVKTLAGLNEDEQGLTNYGRLPRQICTTH